MNSDKKTIGSLAIALLIPQLLGGLGAIATASSVKTWYPKLEKPSWNPPAAVFGPVWTALYALMGLASWRIWKKGEEAPRQQEASQTALKLYGAQLGLNTLWSMVFFGLRRVDLALGEIGVLWSFILGTVVKFGQIDRTAGLLLIPYLAWTSFAAALNAAVYWLNRK